MSDVEGHLMRDAETAWQFFTNTAYGLPTGLAPAAVWPKGSGLGRYAILTMWDVGSLILATVSARKIGLISEKAFDARVKGILQFLERHRFNWGGAQLPNFRTDVRSGRSVEFGYDSTDMGRLFVALHVLDRATAGSYRIARLVGRWNIEATIDDGALFDVKSSRRLKSEAHN